MLQNSIVSVPSRGLTKEYHMEDNKNPVTDTNNIGVIVKTGVDSKIFVIDWDNKDSESSF